MTDQRERVRRANLRCSLRMILAGALIAAATAAVIGLRAPGVDAAVPSLVPITPERFFDTRDEGQTVDGLGLNISRLGGAAVITLPVAYRGSVPHDAVGVMFNVTVVSPAGPGFVTVYSCDDERPNASNINYSAGDVVANAAFSQVSSARTVCFYARTSTDLVIDVTGYVQGDGSPVSVAPARLLETRSGGNTATVDGVAYGIGPLPGGQEFRLPVAARGNVAADAAAVLLNVTAVAPSEPGFVTVYPCGTERPTASNLNYAAGQVVANLVVAKIGVGGDVCIFTRATTDLIVDVNGFVPADGSLRSLAPARLMETRSEPGARTTDGQVLGGGPVAGGTSFELEVARGGVPSDAVAVLLNVTAVDPAAGGFVTVYPCGTDRPTASNLNYGPGDVVPNAVLAKVGPSGTVCIFTRSTTHLVVDVNGYVPASYLDPATVSTVAAPSTTVPPAGPATAGVHGFRRVKKFGGLSAVTRWNPCEPIEYVVNQDRASTVQVELLNEAIADVERATGLDFVFVGTRSDGLDGSYPETADVSIVFTTESESLDQLNQGDSVGLTTSQNRFWMESGELWSEWFVSSILIDVGPGEGRAMAATLRHELGHLVGLAHVDNPYELMFPASLEKLTSTFGPGDLEGMWHLGAAQPCIPEPPGLG